MLVGPSLPGVPASLPALLDAAWKAALPGKARLGVGEDAHHAGAAADLFAQALKPVGALPNPPRHAPHQCGVHRRATSARASGHVAPMHRAGYLADGRRMEAVAKLGRARFGRPIQAKKSAQRIASACGTFFEVQVFGGSATASMRRPCDLPRHACAMTKSPCVVVTITTALPPRTCRTNGSHGPRSTATRGTTARIAPSAYAPPMRGRGDAWRLLQN